MVLLNKINTASKVSTVSTVNTVNTFNKINTGVWFLRCDVILLHHNCKFRPHQQGAAIPPQELKRRACSALNCPIKNLS